MSVAGEAERFAQQAHQFAEAASGLDDLALLDPSLCRGWSRLDLVVHVRLGLEEMAAGLGVRADDAPDHDDVTYWSSFAADEQDPVPGLMWLRRTASAYARPTGATAHLRDAAERACAASALQDPRPVRFQGKVLSVTDFLRTWSVELALHLVQLDVGVVPSAAGLARRTLEALTGAPLPVRLTDHSALRVALGADPWPADEPGGGAYPLGL